MNADAALEADAPAQLPAPAGPVAGTRVLLVEDSLSLAELYREYLRREPVEVRHVEAGLPALDEIESFRPQAVLLDLVLPDIGGLDVLRRAKAQGSRASYVVITAHGSVQVAVEAMQAGASDFLVKPFSKDRLLVTLKNALERQRLVELVDNYQRHFARDRYHGFIGGSLAMQQVYRIIESAAPSKATVFITGESGTGKEVCAEAIHRQSPRAEAPFVALNCAAIPRDLMESEIFGHIRGAFTGATADRDGAASRADGGTLFLDEICEMDLALQTKLLRFVQTGSFQKVGGTRLEKVDVRFICATNRDPVKEVEEGRFREDLYYRLQVIPIHLPPLREREGDVGLIAADFLRDFAAEEGKAFEGFDADSAAVLESYSWPGNVRQLQNVVRNIVVLNDGRAVTRAMLPKPLDLVDPRAPAAGLLLAAPGGAPPAAADTKGAAPSSLAWSGPDAIRPLAELERQIIERALDLCDGNVPQAAARLGISASTIYRKRQSW